MHDGTHGASGGPGRAARRRLWARAPVGRVVVVGRSMEPALLPGDWLLVRWGGRPRPGDLLVLRRPDRPELLVVKRAVRRLDRGWWVAGDNPAYSDDSRVFGVVPDSAVLGRVLLRYWPWRRT